MIIRIKLSSSFELLYLYCMCIFEYCIHIFTSYIYEISHICTCKYYFTYLRFYMIHFIYYFISSHESFKLFILFILTYVLNILHMKSHLYKSITYRYCFINTSNSEVLIWNVISISFKLFTCIILL
jgi:hypothetical protein